MAEGEAELRHLDQAAHLLQQTGHASLARHVSKTRRMRLEQLDLTGTSDADVCPRCSTIRIPGETTVIKRFGSQCTACHYMDRRSSVRRPSRASCLSRQKTLTSGSKGTASALTGQPRQQQGQDKVKAVAVQKDKEKGKAKSRERKKARQQGLLRAMAQSQVSDSKQKTKAAGSGLDLSDFML